MIRESTRIWSNEKEKVLYNSIINLSTEVIDSTFNI